MAAEVVDSAGVGAGRLGRLTGLRDVEPAALARLGAASRAVHLPAGAVLCEAGEPATDVYWLERGFLNAAEPGTGLTIGWGGADTWHWGSRDAYLRRPRTLRIAATRDSAVVAVPVEAYEHLLETSASALRGELTLQQREIGYLVARAELFVRHDLPRRLARVLLDEHPPGVFVDLAMTRAELARVVGGSRQEVSAALRELERRGWVQVGDARGALRVVDPEGLARYAPELAVERAPSAVGERVRAAGPADLPPQLAPLAAIAEVVRFAPRERLVARGSEPRRLLLLLDGLVVARTGGPGGGVRLYDAQPGDLLGARAALAGSPAPAELAAASPVVAVAVPVAVALTLLADPSVARPLVHRPGVRHHDESVAQLTALAARGPGDRLAALLVARADGDGRVAGDVRPAFLAAEVATSRQTVSSRLAAWVRSGVLERRDGGLRVIDRLGSST